MHPFTKEIIDYYRQNKRDLPWRNTKNPYLIWISEIILQQTRVEQGISYYFKITERFPDVKSLATAPLDELLKLWEGLGYYSRARNMHHAAKEILEKHNGKFPNEFNDIISLKGIGEYTAAAIASFAFNIPKPAIDGNVQRVIARYFGIKEAVNTKEGILKIKAVSEETIPKEIPAIYNQAMMEYGATLCKPKNPNCANCSLNNSCFAFQNKLTEEIPAKEKKLKRKSRFFHYLILETPNGYVIKKRTNNDIWQNLYDFPCVESNETLALKNALKEFKKISFLENVNFKITNQYETIKHVLTHADIYCVFYTASTSEHLKFGENDNVLTDYNFKNYPFPRLITRFFDNNLTLQY